MDGLETSSSANQLRVRVQVKEIFAERRSSKDSNRSFVSFSVIPRNLERLPCAFQKHALLRIGNLSFTRSKTKELRIEKLDILNRPSSRNVVRAAQQLWALACCE